VVDWAQRLASGSGFDPSAERLIEVAVLIDTIYERSRLPDDVGEHSAGPDPSLLPSEVATS
jgi:hypothetical protein